MEKLPRIALTHGDINGIGYEVILKTFEDERIFELCVPVLFGSAKVLSFYSKKLNIPIKYNVIASPTQALNGVLNIVECINDNDLHPEPGASTEEAGKAALLSLEKGVEALAKGEVDLLVTAPINKKNIQSETFIFPGHTEYLESKASEGESANEPRALMILASENIKIAPVTTHIPLNQVPDVLSSELILEKLRVFNKSLKRDFGIHHPRIAVLSLNPHAGEEGLLGTEEADIIVPAISKAKDEKIMAFGPYASDGFFGSGRFVKFDGVLAMYHDQGLTPFKLMSMDSGVNFTAGLPWIRTSPDHGTGYDICGLGEASAESMRQAVYTAIDILRHRRRHDEASNNPLAKQTADVKQTTE